jgi:uncharacterized membrane protein
LFTALLRQWPTYLAYVTSYFDVGVVWLNHKAAFRRIRSIDRGLHPTNFGVLFTTAPLPFATAVIADAAKEENLADIRPAVGLYAAIGALLCLSWRVFFDHLHRHPDLVADGVEGGFFGAERTRALVGVILYLAAAFVGMLLSPGARLDDLPRPAHLLCHHEQWSSRAGGHDAPAP